MFVFRSRVRWVHCIGSRFARFAGSTVFGLLTTLTGFLLGSLDFMMDDGWIIVCTLWSRRVGVLEVVGSPKCVTVELELGIVLLVSLSLAMASAPEENTHPRGGVFVEK